MALTFEEKMTASEANDGKVQVTAVEKAKENLATKKLEFEAREVERRLASAESTESKALKELRFARKKEATHKDYLDKISEARTAFETDGNCRKYDEAVTKAEEARDEAIMKAKREIYGSDYWNY